ncbi:hypothetical protein K6V98_00135 [Collinsella sp. AGMB00827]|uniref:Flagellum-specific ATP synthase FliI n=1 Tax=Collinsella ureilytica TaxID=2869515 RepID=A0ABS7MIB9_9ACTN|nr:hypothetical protein [Collinsella urealyticum]MBY4796778.1 hypothetical protein [Collinsella urealyticum]
MKPRNSAEVEQAGSIGRAMAEVIGRGAYTGSSFDRRIGTVASVGNGVLDIEIVAGEGGSTLQGIPMTTACAGAKPGDRVVVDTVDRHSLAIGIIAG